MTQQPTDHQCCQTARRIQWIPEAVLKSWFVNSRKVQTQKLLHYEMLEQCLSRFLTDSCLYLHLTLGINSSSPVVDCWDFDQMDYLHSVGSTEEVRQV